MTPTNDAPAANQAAPQLSYGQKAVGLTFNPSNDPEVQNIKVAYAAIIDRLQALRVTNEAEGDAGHEANRCLAIAIHDTQTAQMWAVKGVTWGK